MTEIVAEISQQVARTASIAGRAVDAGRERAAARQDLTAAQLVLGAAAAALLALGS